MKVKYYYVQATADASPICIRADEMCRGADKGLTQYDFKIDGKIVGQVSAASIYAWWIEEREE